MSEQTCAEFVDTGRCGHTDAIHDAMADGVKLTETWVVRHDAWPRCEEFVYGTEEEARSAFERSGFYDPATGWGVTLIRRVRGSRVLATTKPVQP